MTYKDGLAVRRTVLARYTEAECQWSHDYDMYVIHDGTGVQLGSAPGMDQAWEDAALNMAIIDR